MRADCQGDGGGLIVTIDSLGALQALVAAGETDWKQYGEVNADYLGGMALFNYTIQAQFKSHLDWNWFERNSRGLILDAVTGAVVARPWNKFWTYGEDMPAPDATLVDATAKLDGSLAILFERDGDYFLTGRQHFLSPHIRWATPFFRQRVRRLPDEWRDYTLIFEAIHPDNRIVVNYHGMQDLVLLGARHKLTGEEARYSDLATFAATFNFPQPQQYFYGDPQAYLKAAAVLSANDEGWVLRYDDGSRFKIKGDAYKLAHRIMTGCTFNRVLDAVAQGHYEPMIDGVPDEFLGQVRAWKTEIDRQVFLVEYECAGILRDAPLEQKEFALWVQANFNKTYQSYLFAAKAGKPLTPIVYKHAFVHRADADRTLAVDEA